jgi:predicted nuclease with TOPRIM domain
MADIASALMGFDFVRKTIKRISELQKDNETLTAVNEALAKLGEVQDKLFELREENLALQDKNRELADLLSKRSEWDNRKAGFRLVHTVGGGTCLSE